MVSRAKPKATQAAPGSLGALDFLDDVTRPAKPETKPANVDDLASAPSENVSRDVPEQGVSAKRQPSRASKHHVSLYITPAVDRAMKRIALDEERKAWEVYHEALREYLDRKGQSFDDLMRDG